MEIQEIRAKLNMTQDEFAQFIGVARATVNRWEQGRTKPSQMALKLINELINPKVEKETENEN